MKTKQLFTVVFAGLMLAGMFAACTSEQDAAETSTTRVKAPKMKMTTEVPPGVATPDKLETSLGTLTSVDGVPDAETTQKVYDNLDL
ncbi:unnamed protein product, partial [marine sediment metagenome]